MKTLTSLKIAVVASCLLLSPFISAEEKQAEKFTRSGITSSVFSSFAKYEWQKHCMTTKGLAGLALMTSLFIYFSREADDKPNRYNVEELKQNPSFRNTLKFVYYFLLDGVIGNARRSSSAKVGDDGKTIVVKPGAPARGLYGTIADITKPIGETLGFVAATGKFLKSGVNGLMEWELAEVIL